ncbi:tripartite tricarboxylate transporter TctB family protein [Pseudooceanicola nanhaiensis]|uniref:tripartite tricarboxylate transporter TctB family protein n=1 Tax=Pseudooceanicola nanhaiensis TaxID=375761 RepID=UPI0040582C9B
MTTERERRFPGPRRGQLGFAIALLVVSVLLLAQIGAQTRWIAGAELFAQPRFWPAVGLGLMTGLAALYLVRLPWRRFTRADATEALKWLAALEFVAWFLVYVWLVPIVGYLPVTMVFVPALAWRMGYRSARWMAGSVALAVAIVVLFKSVLAVRIPGAAAYDHLPDGLRSFFILHF